MTTVFLATGTFRRPFVYVLKRFGISVFFLSIYVFLQSEFSTAIALIGTAITLSFAIRVRTRGMPQMMKAISQPDGTVVVFGRFQEKNISYAEKKVVRTISRTADGLRLQLMDFDQASEVTLSTPYFLPESLDAMAKVLAHLIDNDTAAILKQVPSRLKVRSSGEQSVVTLTEKPSYILMSWLSTGLVFIALYGIYLATR